MATKHAVLSASSSERWLNCPPSARLCETYEDKGSDYAAEGTDAHSLCEYKLRMALGMEAVMASGTAKVVNLTSNLAALISLFSTGNVLIALGLPAALCGIAGNWVGAGLTIKKGVGFIRYMLLVVFAGIVWPLTFPLFQKLGRKDEA